MFNLTKDDAVDVLIERLGFWTNNSDVISLYEVMYKERIANGYYVENQESIMAIVDNDYVNYCDTLEEGDKYFNEILECYENGDFDISDKNLCYSWIEAVSSDKTLILVRS